MPARRALVTLLGVLLAIPTLAATAQTPAADAIPAEEDLAGLQGTVWRAWGRADAFVGEGTLPVDGATPAAQAPATLRSISVVVREFDTAANAAIAYARIGDGVEASMAGVFTDGTQEFTRAPLPGIGTQATLIRVDHTGPGSDVWIENAIVQRDRYVLVVSADASVFTSRPDAGGADRSLPTADLAARVAAGEPSPDAPELRADGMSTGGLWGFMPPADDPLLMGLVPFSDSVVFPPPDAP